MSRATSAPGIVDHAALAGGKDEKKDRALILTLSLSACVVTSAVVIAQASYSGVPQATALDVVISEIAWMGTTASASDEWLELHNNTSNTVDLSGWTLSAADGTPSISLARSIPPAAYFLLECTDDDSLPGVTADHTYTGGLGNEGEDLVLRNASSAVIDQVDCTSGWFAGHAEARVPMVRTPLTTTGSISTSWTYNPRCGTATNSAGISESYLSPTDLVAFQITRDIRLRDGYWAVPCLHLSQIPSVFPKNYRKRSLLTTLLAYGILSSIHSAPNINKLATGRSDVPPGHRPPIVVHHRTVVTTTLPALAPQNSMHAGDIAFVPYKKVDITLRPHGTAPHFGP